MKSSNPVRVTRRIVRAMGCMAMAVPVVVAAAWWPAMHAVPAEGARVYLGRQAWPVPVPADWGACTAVRLEDGKGMTLMTAETKLTTMLTAASGPGEPPCHAVVVLSAGWPLPAMRAWLDFNELPPRWIWGVAAPEWMQSDSEISISGAARPLPLQPLMAGFLVDWLLAAALLWCLASGVALAAGWWRTRRGRCGLCGHAMAGAVRCPECGQAVRRPAAQPG